MKKLFTLIGLCLLLNSCTSDSTYYETSQFVSEHPFVIDKITKLPDGNNMYESTYVQSYRSGTKISNYSRIVGPIGFTIGDTLILKLK